jgi:hypothetical protein
MSYRSHAVLLIFFAYFIVVGLDLLSLNLLLYGKPLTICGIPLREFLKTVCYVFGNVGHGLMCDRWTTIDGD